MGVSRPTRGRARGAVACAATCLLLATACDSEGVVGAMTAMDGGAGAGPSGAAGVTGMTGSGGALATGGAGGAGAGTGGARADAGIDALPGSLPDTMIATDAMAAT